MDRSATEIVIIVTISIALCGWMGCCCILRKANVNMSQNSDINSEEVETHNEAYDTRPIIIITEKAHESKSDQ